MFDDKCYQLAESFLSDSTVHTQANLEFLAQAIQDTIESWIGDWEDERQARLNDQHEQAAARARANEFHPTGDDWT